MIAFLHCLFVALMVRNVVASQLAEPTINRLDGLYQRNRIGSTVINGCYPGDSFFVSGDHFPVNGVPQVMLSVKGHVSTSVITCSPNYTTQVRCKFPSNVPQDVWLSVSLTFDGKVWSEEATPGFRVIKRPAGYPSISSISNSCDVNGCSEGMVLTIVGSSLLDKEGSASVALSPDFNRDDEYGSRECRIKRFSSTEVVHCVLPHVPDAYIEIDLQVRLRNSKGASIIAGSVRYAASLQPTASNAYFRGPQFSVWDSSGYDVPIAYVPCILLVDVVIVISLVVLSVMHCRASRRRKLLALLSNPDGPSPSAYVALHNQSACVSRHDHSSQPPHLLIQPQTYPFTSHQHHVPLLSVQYQPVYQQYPAGDYHPTFTHVPPR